MNSFAKFSRRDFLTTAAAASASTLLPKAVLAQDPGVISSKTGTPKDREKIAWQLRSFPLKQVRLGEGPCKDAMEADRRYLHSLPPDRLLHTFRLNAGLASSAEALGGWEKPDCELRGHYTGGHYLSACALMYASTGDEDLKKNANTVVAELGKCQDALKSGYLSAFPTELFDRLRDARSVWAPFYTYHKIMAGMLEMYVHCGNEQALGIAEKMAAWTDWYTDPLSYEHMQRVLSNEYGGMGESLANLYAITGRERYLAVAQRFDKKVFFDPLAHHRDELKGLHANTHIPQVIAAARLYELTGDRRYRDIAEYFWDEVVSERTYCMGGTSNHEHWRTGPGELAKELSPETAEDCCAYNMMKLTRHLFGWSADARLMDYYERTLFNHRLGTINTSDGAIMYFLSVDSGAWKTYGTQLDSFWCCTGTGSEEFAKLGDTIYFHDDDSVYVNLYIASQVEWPEKGLSLRQDTRFPEQQGTTITVSAKSPTAMAINLRVPYWANGGSVKINGILLQAFSTPTSYVSLNRVWKNGDKIELNLPMDFHAAPMPDDEHLQAVMYGPLVLAGRFDEVSKEKVYGYQQPKPTDKFQAPEIVAPMGKPEWLRRDDKAPLTFRSVGQSTELTLVPLYRVDSERYEVYWNVKGKQG